MGFLLPKWNVTPNCALHATGYTIIQPGTYRLYTVG